ncbi:MAG: hypothetical protein JSW28_06440 [Thermoplasmata archaeon]|nr:MAG: hypothetical protein JSW28_06440 [Thermoplasmata archaeon]
MPMEVLAPSNPKTVYGEIYLNATHNEIAYPGNSTFYIMNWRENGTDTGHMVSSGGIEYFAMDIEDNITWWEVGDAGVVIVDVENGTYFDGNRMGFVAYTTTVLTVGDDVFPEVELQKIPVPELKANGTGFINITWDPLPDPFGLVAGYKVYRSLTNNSDASWELVGGSKDAPLTETWFNNSFNVTDGYTYYYSIKVSFIGYENDIPGNVNNHQNMYFGEGSVAMMSAPFVCTVDWIAIVDTPGTGLFNISDDTVDVGFKIQGWAAAFNASYGYLDDIPVTWSVINGSGATAFTLPLSGDNSVFNASKNGGTVTWRAEDTEGNIDTVTFIINLPVVDEIYIVDTPNTGMTPILDQTVDVGFTTIGWAAAYNDSVGYIGDVDVTWSVLNSGGANAKTTPGGPSTSSNYNSSSPDGSATWTADYTGITDDVTFTINPPGVDDIYIVDTQYTGMTPILDKSIGIDTIIEGYAAAYNDSVGYIGDISVIWDVINVGSSAVTNPLSGANSTFDAKPEVGTATWKAEYPGGINDTVEFTILAPLVDYIMIVDSAGTGEFEIPDQIIGVGKEATGYAAAFNYSIGYLGDVSAGWDVDLGSASTNPGTGITSEFSAGLAGGTATWTANYTTDITDTVVFTIMNPTIDYIQIQDSQGNEVTTVSLTIGDKPIYRCMAFNITAGPIGTVAADWAVDTTIGEFNPETGTMTQFNATAVGTGNITAILGGLTDATGLITVNEAPDTTPPAIPTGLVVIQVAEGNQLDLTWIENTDTDLAYYNVYKSVDNITFVKTVMVVPTLYTDTGLTDGTTYYYRITAVDISDNESPQSATAFNTADKDTDDDGTFDLVDTDDDNDGYLDSNDGFPLDSTEWLDTDDDGTGNNADPDDDNDNLTDAVEVDMGTNPLNPDTDGDGYFDDVDVFPNNDAEWVDSDGDGVGDNADAFPDDPDEWTDTDGDGVGDNSDAFPNDDTEWEDSDGDGIGDNSDFLPNLHTYIFNGIIIGIIILIVIIISIITKTKSEEKKAQKKAERDIAELESKIKEMQEKGIKTDELEKILEETKGKLGEKDVQKEN